MEKDTVVYIDGDYIIVECVRIFCCGFNCYKSDIHGGNNFTKINCANSFFISFDDAKEWLNKYIAKEGA